MKPARQEVGANYHEYLPEYLIWWHFMVFCEFLKTTTILFELDIVSAEFYTLLYLILSSAFFNKTNKTNGLVKTVILNPHTSHVHCNKNIIDVTTTSSEGRSLNLIHDLGWFHVKISVIVMTKMAALSYSIADGVIIRYVKCVICDACVLICMTVYMTISTCVDIWWPYVYSRYKSYWYFVEKRYKYF